MAAGLRFHTQAGLLTSFITALPFPVSQWITRPLPYTVTASLRIPTGFPFHLLLSRHLCATTLYFSDSGIISHFVELSIRFMAGLSRTHLRQHRTIASASLGRLFAPLLQFVKREIHTVFLRFPNFEFGQKSWLSLLVKLCGVALKICLCLFYPSSAQRPILIPVRRS